MNMSLSLGRFCLRVVGRNGPIPLSTVLLLRKFSAGTDSLVPRNVSGGRGSSIRHPMLSQSLAEVEMGAWSLCVRTVDFLEQQIETHRPSAILEFGSGTSTVCLARFMHDVHGDSDRTYVISVEQNPEVAEATVRRLSAMRLDRYVRLVCAPLSKQRIADRDISCYSIAEDDLKQIASLKPDFILVDGPAAEVGSRFGTIPLVRHAVAPDARVYLDDAFRDSELNTAKTWLTVLGIEIEGVLPTQKGLLIGRLRTGF